MSNRTLYEVYLKPWRAIGAAGARATMPSHNTVNDIPAHANKPLLDMYRARYGFGSGVTLSDCNDIGAIYDYRMVGTRTEAAATALKAGVDWDLQCGNSPENWSYNKLKDALDQGLASGSDLDKAVSHVLTQKFAMRLFDKAQSVPTDAIKILDAPQHRTLALEAAEQSITLLINRNATLPLADLSSSKIALIGPGASSKAGAKSGNSLIGPYSLTGANITTVNRSHVHLSALTIAPLSTG